MCPNNLLWIFLANKQNAASVGARVAWFIVWWLGYELDNQGIMVWFPAGARGFSSVQSVGVTVLAHVATFSLSTGCLFLGKADHSPPSTAGVKNEWGYTSTTPICLHGMYRDSLIFTLYSTSKTLPWQQTEWKWVLIHVVGM